MNSTLTNLAAAQNTRRHAPKERKPLRIVKEPQGRYPYAHNPYCGPAALSILLGISTGDAASEIRELRYEYTMGVIRDIKSATGSELFEVLRRNGKKVFRLRKFKEPITCGAWLKKSREVRRDDDYLIGRRGHFFVARGDYILCNLMCGVPRNINDKWSRPCAAADRGFMWNMQARLDVESAWVARVIDRNPNEAEVGYYA